MELVKRVVFITSAAAVAAVVRGLVFTNSTAAVAEVARGLAFATSAAAFAKVAKGLGVTKRPVSTTSAALRAEVVTRFAFATSAAAVAEVVIEPHLRATPIAPPIHFAYQKGPTVAVPTVGRRGRTIEVVKRDDHGRRGRSARRVVIGDDLINFGT